MSSGKGSSFERSICRQLSLWCSNGKRDDIYWRTAGSGGMARRRGRDGRQTRNQHGDILAVDAIGAPLLDIFTVELKRGYQRLSLADMLDTPSRILENEVRIKKREEQQAAKAKRKQKKQKVSKRKDGWREWIYKAEEAVDHSGTYTWALIHRRDKREAMICIPAIAFRFIRDECEIFYPRPLCSALCTVPVYEKTMEIFVMQLDTFLQEFTPQHAQALSKVV